MPYRKNFKAYKQAGDGEEAGGDEQSSLRDNPLMRQIAKLAEHSIDQQSYSLYSTLLNKYARKFESFNALLTSSARFGAGNPTATIDKLYTISGSIVEALEDLQNDIDHNKLEKVLDSIMAEWSNAYRLAKMNLLKIDNFKHNTGDISVPAIKTALEVLKKALAELTLSLDAYSGYFEYAQKPDERNATPRQDYSKFIATLENELDALSLTLYMPYQTAEMGPSLRKNMMQGAALRICDRLVEIIRPFIDTNSKTLVKENAKAYNLLHDISISATAMWKMVGRLDTNKKFIEVVKRDLLAPLANVVYLLNRI